VWLVSGDAVLTGRLVLGADIAALAVVLTVFVVLGTRKAGAEGGKWEAQVLSTAHNGENPDEVDFVRAAHPNEPECVLHDRVLGAIAVTRGECTTYT
jgi:hypothetical protein